MIYVLFILAVFSATFLNSNISTVLGYENNVTTVAFLPLTLFIIIQLMRKKIVILKKDNNSSRYVLLASILILFFKLSYGQYDMFKTILLFSFIPYTFAMYLEHASCKEKTVLQNVLIALLVTECLLAVYERVTLTVLLSTEETYSSMNRAGDTWSFRSSALFGHPLGNAMLVSVINIYILSSNLSPLRKISCFAIAIIALLCFNERGNIVITLATSLPLLIKKNKIIIWISNYGDKSRKLGELINILRQERIDYTVLPLQKWSDVIQLNNEKTIQEDAKRLKRRKDGCVTRCRTVAGGRFYLCSLLKSMDFLGIKPFGSGDYVDLYEDDARTKIMRMLDMNTPLPRACSFCSGCSKVDWDNASIKVAEQISRPLNFIKTRD